MKELFTIIYRRPVPKKFREKNDVTFFRPQNKAHQRLAGCKPEKLLVWKFSMRNTAAKLTFPILKFNVTFIDKSHGHTKRRCVRYLKPDPSPK